MLFSLTFMLCVRCIILLGGGGGGGLRPPLDWPRNIVASKCVHVGELRWVVVVSGRGTWLVHHDGWQRLPTTRGWPILLGVNSTRLPSWSAHRAGRKPHECAGWQHQVVQHKHTIVATN